MFEATKRKWSNYKQRVRRSWSNRRNLSKAKISSTKAKYYRARHKGAATIRQKRQWVVNAPGDYARGKAMNFVSGDPRVGGAHMTKWVGAIGEAGAARAVESINARNEANISKLYWRMQDRLQDSMTRRYRGLQKTAGKAFLSKKHPDWETKLQFGSNKYRYQLDPRTGRRVRALTQFEEKALMYPMYKQKLREAKLRQMYATTDADYLVAADEYKSLKKGMSRAKSSSKGFNINIGSTIRNLPTVREADALVENKERYLAKMHLRKQIMISQMIASGALNEKEIKSLKF